MTKTPNWYIQVDVSSKFPIIGLIVILVVAGIILYNRTRTSPSVSQPLPLPTSKLTPTEEISPIPLKLPIILNQENQSGESGQATLEEVDGKVRVNLNLTGALSDVPQPSHIHLGSCAQLGDVKYPLTSVLNGQASTTLDVSLPQLLDQLPLAINVHKSSNQAGIYVSCGDLLTK